MAAANDAGTDPAPPLSPSATVAADDGCARVFSPVTGRVARIVAQVGQTVKAGDPLLTIQPPGADDASTSEVHKAQANLIAAERDLKRQKELNELDHGTVADLEASDDAYRRAKARLERARARAVPRGPLFSTRDGYTLPAPTDGEVVSCTVNPGDRVDEVVREAGAPRALFVIRPSGATCHPDP